MIGIRSETPSDAAAIRRVHVEAFGQSDEADLVDALRAAGALRISLVAAEAGTVVGHVAFSPLVVRGGASTINALGLAPMAGVAGIPRPRHRLAAGAGRAGGLRRHAVRPCFRARRPAVLRSLRFHAGQAPGPHLGTRRPAGRLHGSGAATGHAARHSRRRGVPAGIRWFVVTATPQPPLSGGLSGFRPIPPDKGGKGGYVIKRSEACESA